MNSSRIFIRGLPSSMNDEDFRNHFSKLSTVTDAKYLPRRRIGYVGYKTHEDALKATKYFNKSFIRMSRIAVELAKPVELYSVQRPEPPSFDTRKGGLAQTTNDQSQDARSTDAKLQEFLEVMQPPSKSKTWANEDLVATQVNVTAFKVDPSPKVGETQSDEEYQHIPKKRRRSPDDPKKTDKNVKQKVDNEASEVTMLPPEVAPSNITVSEDHSENTSQHFSEVMPPASDQDWLRARTSRLLGLLDDNNDAIVLGHLAPDSVVHNKIRQSPIEVPSIRRESDDGHQTDHEKQDQPDIETTKVLENNKQEMTVTNRLFVRNLPYDIKEDDLRERFNSFGDLEEIHIPLDSRSKTTKGFAYVQYTDNDSAKQAIQELDGKSFQGRLLHILPATARKNSTLDDYAISKLPIKKQKQIKQKAEAASATFKWNSMYMNADAVMSSISDRLGISKSELLDPTSSQSAIKQAHAETNIIQETKAYFAANNVDLMAFKNKERDDTTILVKNFSYGTTIEDLRKLFETYGNITKLLMPPAGTIAIVEFECASDARSALRAVAYRKFKDSILFLEKAPKKIFTSTNLSIYPPTVGGAQPVKSSAVDLMENTVAEDSVDTSTLFVKNLNFLTTTERMREVFSPLDGFMSARVKTKPDPKKPGEVLSMGFGFLEFRSKQQAQAAIAAMNGYKLDGHELVIKTSHKALNAAEERRKDDQAKKVAGRRTKIIIKNLPFEASKKDIRSLFGAYGQLRSVRVPKKFDSSTRGFAFANFVTAREAENAMDALKDTHLLGRRLVLDFAIEDAVDPEEEIEKMQRKVRKQAEKVTLQKLTGVGRKKFNVEGAEDVDTG